MKKKLSNVSGISLNTNLISRKNEFRLFLFLALSGLILRGLYLFEYAHFVNFDLAIGADIGEYYSRSQEISKGIFFPVSPEIHAPLYSFFLAALQKIGLSIPAIRIFQTFLNFFSWIGLYFLLRRREKSVQYSFVFLGISMILAPLIFHPAELISESLLLPLLTIVFFSFHFADEYDEKKRSVANLCSSSAGIFSALALLTHGMMTGFFILESLYLLYRKKWLQALFFLLGFFLILSPFIIVKSCHYGKLSGIQANTGFNIFLGNNPRATGLCYMRPGNVWRKTHFQANKTAESRKITANYYFLEKVWDFWKNKPFKGIVLYLKKIPLIFSGKEYIAGADGGFLFTRTDTINLLRFFTFPVFLLAAFGLFKIFRQKELFWAAPLLLALSLLIMQILTVTSGRYRLMMFPGIIYLAAIGAYHLKWKRWILIFLLIFGVSVWKTYSFMGADKAEGTALLGQGHFLKGNYTHAKELLQFAGKRFRDASRIDNMLGNIAEREKNLPEARRIYSKVTAAEPFMPEGWMNLANVTPDPRKADKFFRMALKAASPFPAADLTYNYANFLYTVKRIPEAEKMVEQTIKTDPAHVMGLNLSGLIAAGKGDFSKASELFFRAAQLKPQEAGFWKNTAVTARMAGNAPLEKRAAQKYLDLMKEKRQ